MGASRADPRWLEIYRALFAAFGPQHWWPGDTPIEVMIGAILTQNTAWSNVERAIARLAQAQPLSGPAILALEPARLAELIRPAGYFNLKARRLKAWCAFLEREAALDDPGRLGRHTPLATLRPRLLAVHGIGAETADSILLYALGRPSFVVDAYTRRIFSRLGLIDGKEPYAAIQAEFTRHLPEDAALYNEYHALIVHLGKGICRTKPCCRACPLAPGCRHAGAQAP